MNTIEELFAARGYRLTMPRRQVFNELQKASRPLAIGDIITACGGVDRVSIYRTLELFAELDIISVIPVGWKKRYELAGPFKPHHHHLQCVSCGELVAIDTPRLEGMVTDLATSHGYKLAHHHIELSGICEMCQKA
jgi:Fe2+ or Zn2+ uptake regulation protein